MSNYDNNFENPKDFRRNNFKKNTRKKKHNYEEDIDFTKKARNAFKNKLREIKEEDWKNWEENDE